MGEISATTRGHLRARCAAYLVGACTLAVWTTMVVLREHSSTEMTGGVPPVDGYGLSVVQLAATVAAAVFTAWAAWGAGAAANAAKESLTHSRETSEGELRAYVNLESAHLLLGEDYVLGKRGVLDLVFRNFGSTPAREVRSEIILRFAVPPLSDRRFPWEVVQSHGAVGPTASVKIRHSLDLDRYILDGLQRDAPYLSVQGKITYKAFGREAETSINIINGHPIFKDITGGDSEVVGYHFRAADGGNDCT